MIKTWVRNENLKPDPLHFSNLVSMPEVIERLNYFRKLSANGLENLTSAQYARLQSEVIQYFNSASYTVAQLPIDFVVYRATVNSRITGINEHYLTKVSQLIGPPKALLKKRGRGNGLKVPPFYCASSHKTALFEAFPEPGDCVTVSAWKLRPNKVFYYADIFHPDVTRKTEDYRGKLDNYLLMGKAENPLLRHIRSENEKFLTEEFIKDMNGRSDANYLFSSTFAELLFQRRRIWSEPLSGIVYPSTKIRNGNFDLVMPNEIVHEYFELIHLSFVQVKQVIESDVDFRDNEVIVDDPTYSRTFSVEKDEIGDNGELNLEYHNK